MFGFGRAAVPRRPTLQTGNQVILQVAHVQVTSHPTLQEIVALNELTARPTDQGGRSEPRLSPFATGEFVPDPHHLI
jgi:hypothetical protein